jgi:opacity protein-like surface antigen
MNLFKLSLLFSLFCSPIFATYQYFGVDIGVNNLEPTNSSNKGLKVGSLGGIKYGYAFNSGIRAEAEIVYRFNTFRTKYNMAGTDIVLSKEYNRFHSWSFMANCIYDIMQLQTQEITPYIGAGVGYCQNTEKHKIKTNFRSTEDKLKDNRFAYQGIVGVRYAINATMGTALEYNYFCGKNHAKSHSVRMSFNRVL